MPRLLLAGLAVLSAAVAGWVVWSKSNVPPNDQRMLGRELYAQRCANCHDVEGGIGPDLAGAVLRSYGSARTLFNYVKMAMPYDAPGSLSDQEYWATLDFLLDAKDLLPPDVRLSAETADAVLLEASHTRQRE